MYERSDGLNLEVFPLCVCDSADKEEMIFGGHVCLPYQVRLATVWSLLDNAGSYH